MNNLAKRSIALFIILLFVLTAIAHFLSSSFLNQNISSLVIMWMPGLAAIIVGLFTQRSLKKMGWSLSVKWISTGWVIPIVYGFIAYGIVWITGLGGVPNPTFLERARLTLGMSSESDSLIIVAAFFYITIVNLLPAMHLPNNGASISLLRWCTDNMQIIFLYNPPPVHKRTLGCAAREHPTGFSSNYKTLTR